MNSRDFNRIPSFSVYLRVIIPNVTLHVNRKNSVAANWTQLEFECTQTRDRSCMTTHHDPTPQAPGDGARANWHSNPHRMVSAWLMTANIRFLSPLLTQNWSEKAKYVPDNNHTRCLLLGGRPPASSCQWRPVRARLSLLFGLHPEAFPL